MQIMVHMYQRILFLNGLCFQNELDLAKGMWINHYIRRSGNPHVPHGQQNIMHAVSSILNSRDYTCQLNAEDMRACRENATFKSVIPCNKDIYDLCIILMRESSIMPPNDATSVSTLYMHLRTIIKSLL